MINGLPLLDTISRRPHQLTRTPTHHRFGSSAGSPYVHARRARYYRVHLFLLRPLTLGEIDGRTRPLCPEGVLKE